MDFAERIKRARDDLVGRREALVSEIAKIDAEVKEYDTALRVALKLGPDPNAFVSPSTPKSSNGAATGTEGRESFEGTQKELILKLLEDTYPTGLEAGQLRATARERFGVEIKSTTATVTLGRLREDGSVRLDDRAWYFVPEVERTARNEDGASVCAEAPTSKGVA